MPRNNANAQLFSWSSCSTDDTDGKTMQGFADSPPAAVPYVSTTCSTMERFQGRWGQGDRPWRISSASHAPTPGGEESSVQNASQPVTPLSVVYFCPISGLVVYPRLGHTCDGHQLAR